MVKVLDMSDLMEKDNILLDEMKQILKEKNSQEINQIKIDLIEVIDKELR